MAEHFRGHMVVVCPGAPLGKSETVAVPVLQRVGFKATVPDAPPEVLKMVDYTTKTLGGDGAAREVIDLLRKVQKIPGPHEKG